MPKFHHLHPFKLESGDVLPAIEVEYQTWGQLNEAESNVIWICHALTANADATDWWDGLVGYGKLFDPDKHFIICANMLGSCYGSSNALSVNEATGEPYYHDFPLITVRDMVAGLELLRKHLDIEQIHTLIGGSMGGQQALEWAIQQPNLFKYLIPLATNAQHSPWGIAFNEAQRLAIQADQTWKERQPEAGQQGLKAARSIAILSYRNYQAYQLTQSEQEDDKLDNYLPSSYQNYQGEKLTSRFNAFAYFTLSKAMDSHHVGRGRKSISAALAKIKAKTLVIGITSDVLFPLKEQILLAREVPDAQLVTIDSNYGHDGFLIEYAQIERKIKSFYTRFEKVEEKEHLLKA